MLLFRVRCLLKLVIWDLPHLRKTNPTRTLAREAKIELKYSMIEKVRKVRRIRVLRNSLVRHVKTVLAPFAPSKAFS